MRLVALFVVCTSILFAGTDHFLKQWVTNVPMGQEKWGYKFTVFDMYQPVTNVLNEASPGVDFVWTGTGKLKWEVNCAYFPVQWDAGDTILCFGSWDSAYAADSVNYGNDRYHIGYAWFYSDTLDNKRIQNWLPEDTLRPLPKPLVSTTGVGGGSNDTLWIRIPNPQETRRADQTTYDVLGYWIWADTTGAGTPNALTSLKAVEIGFIPVQGVYGDTTVYWQFESDHFLGWNHWKTYFAYKLVVAPDTTLGKSPGYSTYHFSQNSDSVDIYQITVGVEEVQSSNEAFAVRVYPNPFVLTSNVAFSLEIPQRVTLKLYNTSGQLIKAVVDARFAAGCHIVRITATDGHGKILPSGLYYYRLETPEHAQTGTLVKQ